MALAQDSTMANSTRAQLSTDSLSYFPNNSSQLITPQDLRDWLTNGIESFVTQKDTSEFQNAFYECRGSAITATSGTTNLALAGGNFVHVTGTVPPAISITSFGILPAGSRFVLCFDIPVTIVHNATTLIIPGAANIVTSAGDCIMLISEGSGAWRLIGYFPGTGLPVGTVTAVTASSPLSATTGNAPNLSIPQANGSTDGFLDSADWTTFNGKQDALTLTTTGTSGAATLTGATLNIPQYSGASGGTPGGAIGEIQYNVDNTNFGGVSDLTWDDINNQLTIKNPRIGQSVGNGHFHMHNSTSGPPGIADYLTVNWEKSNRSVGFRYEQETFLSYLKFLQPTASRTYTLPDATGNVLMDTVLPVLNNGTSAGEIRLKEATANGNEYIGLKAPAAIATSGTYSLTLPISAPGSGQVMVSDGSGNLSWASNPGTTGAKFRTTNPLSTVTGTTAETFLAQLLIPAGTFTTGDTMKFLFRSQRTLSTSTNTWRFYISDVSGTFNTKPQMGLVTIGSVVAGGVIAERNLVVVTPTNSYHHNSATSTYTDFTGAYYSISNIDWSIDQYAIMTTANNNTTNVTTGISISVSPTG